MASDRAQVFNSSMENKATQLQVFIGRLPNNLLQQIFELLSSMDLSSCWYVCKLWRGLVTDSFIAKNGKPKTFLLHIVHGESKNHTNMFAKDFDFHTKNLIPMKIPLQLDFVNSCNCLLSFWDFFGDDCVFVLNPMTMEYLKLPDSPKKNEPYGNGCFYGFGFSKKSSIYKMIRKTHQLDKSILEVCVVDVNPKNVVWKDIGLLPFDNIGRYPCVYFNGALYWIAEGSRVNSDRVIICRFDVEDENFQPITLPIPILARTIESDSSSCGDYPLIEIGVLDDDFYFLHGQKGYYDPTIEIWLMKENGINDLWTKYLVIQPPITVSSYYLDTWLSFIKVCENGEILMVCDLKYLVLYDPMTKSFRDVKLNLDEETPFLLYQTTETLSFSSLKKLLRGKNADSIS